ncbi:MAG: putative glycoside hydrolase [Candidatus Aminicenantes bacterium]|jgi:hypothetical protein
MAERKELHEKKPAAFAILSILILLIVFPLFSLAQSTHMPEKITGVYFPSNCLNGRNFEGIVHYMEAAGLNMVVLHVKDPKGQIFWNSSNRMAVEMGAPSRNGPLKEAVHILKQRGIWTVAKLDVFQDSLLATNHPELGVMDATTGELWADRKGLHWANPYDQRVWDYTIELCLELIELGIDEIQFDYIRFPSDGDLSRIEYPFILEGTTQAECIGKFLAYANSMLKPMDTTISVDIFGLTAWKTEDFGVGQVLEKMAPHVDVLCPMLYPSHFPENFLRLKNPGQYPYKIIKLSLEEMKRRTRKKIRPWIQGFWYSPHEIIAQLEGAEESGIRSWTIWNPSGGYHTTFRALEENMGIVFPKPQFYPALEELIDREELVAQGQTKIINLTDYRNGYSILSLDKSVDGEPNEYSTLIDVLSTLDESIIDRILINRGLNISQWTNPYTKAQQITNLIVQDIDTDPRRMRPFPIYIDWGGTSVFTKSIPPKRLRRYQNHTEALKTTISGSQR